MDGNLALQNLSFQLDASQVAELASWWMNIAQADRDELNELTRIVDLPWRFQAPVLSGRHRENEVVDDLYEYLVNHEFKPSVPFFGVVSRDGQWGYFSAPVIAIPLCDPDWPPYSEHLYYKPWQARGKLCNADLGFA